MRPKRQETGSCWAFPVEETLSGQLTCHRDEEVMKTRTVGMKADEPGGWILAVAREVAVGECWKDEAKAVVACS